MLWYTIKSGDRICELSLQLLHCRSHQHSCLTTRSKLKTAVLPLSECSTVRCSTGHTSTISVPCRCQPGCVGLQQQADPAARCHQQAGPQRRRCHLHAAGPRADRPPTSAPPNLAPLPRSLPLQATPAVQGHHPPAGKIAVVITLWHPCKRHQIEEQAVSCHHLPAVVGPAVTGIAVPTAICSIICHSSRIRRSICSG